MGFSLEDYLLIQNDWSLRTFGPGAKTQGVLAHIREELLEVASDPTDTTEWVDIVLLAFDGAFRNGASPEDVISALVNKQFINKKRTWPDWRLVPEGQPIKHVKTDGEAQK